MLSSHLHSRSHRLNPKTKLEGKKIRMLLRNYDQARKTVQESTLEQEKSQRGARHCSSSSSGLLKTSGSCSPEPPGQETGKAPGRCPLLPLGERGRESCRDRHFPQDSRFGQSQGSAPRTPGPRCPCAPSRIRGALLEQRPQGHSQGGKLDNIPKPGRPHTRRKGHGRKSSASYEIRAGRGEGARVTGDAWQAPRSSPSARRAPSASSPRPRSQCSLSAPTLGPARPPRRRTGCGSPRSLPRSHPLPQ